MPEGFLQGILVMVIVFFFPIFSSLFARLLLPDSFCGRVISGLPNANAKSPRFSYAISQIATLPPVVALNRNSESQIAARYAAFWHTISQIALAAFLLGP